jgi:hypothetical protein
MADIDYRVAWQVRDPQIEADAIAFWRTHGLLPPKADPKLRAAQLCIVAYLEDVLVAVSTIQVRPLAMMKGERFAMFRCAATPGLRRGGLATQLAARSRQVTEAWSAGVPERRILGMACVVQGPELAAKQEHPIWPLSGMNLAGYNGLGQQVRIAWFAHATVR